MGIVAQQLDRALWRIIFLRQLSRLFQKYVQEVITQYRL